MGSFCCGVPHFGFLMFLPSLQDKISWHHYYQFVTRSFIHFQGSLHSQNHSPTKFLWSNFNISTHFLVGSQVFPNCNLLSFSYSKKQGDRLSISYIWQPLTANHPILHNILKHFLHANLLYSNSAARLWPNYFCALDWNPCSRIRMHCEQNVVPGPPFFNLIPK